MSAPVTTFDQEYSDPAATATGWEDPRKVLETAELSWLSTVRADGRPHVTPVVAAWAEEAIWFSTGAEEQKFANLRANPHVVLTTGCNRWDQGLDVVVEGDAVQVTDDTVLARVAKAFTAKWDGSWQFAARGGCFRGADGSGEAMVFSVAPVKVFATPRAIRSAPPGTGSASPRERAAVSGSPVAWPAASARMTP